ncbi:MAG: hypothetical protein ACK4SZ_02815 [Allosphingosinicella sp.]|uniref:hypothetical protein n=1 Tax=Allosphingosinicella sp. TaxID=2823234 RepID=UPI0039557D46
MALNNLALSTLRHIQIAVEARDRAAPYRTFFDNFYAYYRGGPLLNDAGRPYWFNNPCPRKHRNALASLHFVSSAASRVLAGLDTERLVRDHAIPVAVLREILMNAHPPSDEVVERYLRSFYRLGLITESEDERLSAAGLRSHMPKSWHSHDGAFARYEAVAITAHQVRDEL